MSAIFTSLAPMLSVRQGARAVEFYRAAFGAEEVYRVEAPNGALVARLAIGGAELWVTDESPDHESFSPATLSGTTARMILTVADPESVVERAIAAGARSVHPVRDGDHGWRQGRIVDPFGHHWEIGHPL